MVDIFEVLFFISCALLIAAVVFPSTFLRGNNRSHGKAALVFGIPVLVLFLLFVVALKGESDRRNTAQRDTDSAGLGIAPASTGARLSSPTVNEPAQQERAEPSPVPITTPVMTPEQVEAKLTKIKTAIDSDSLDEAKALLSEILDLAPTNTGVGDAKKLLDAAQGEKIRLAVVDDGIALGRSISADPTLCDTPLQIKNAWDKLRSVKSTDDRYREAQKVALGLERCRKKTIASLTKGIREIMVVQRVAYAERLDEAALENGMDFRIRLDGKYKDRITITWPLMSRVVVRQLDDNGQMTQACEDIGFKRLVFSDGWNESYRYDLSPLDESRTGDETLEKMGLGSPIKL